jgi:hypothetical protein
MIASDGNVVHEAGRTSGASQPAPVALPMDQVRPVLAEGWETGFREIAVGETKWTLTFDLLHTTGWYYVTLSPAS